MSVRWISVASVVGALSYLATAPGCGGGGGGSRLGPNDWPFAAFTATPEQGAYPLEVTFDASASVDPDGTIASYAWDFGDGASGTGVLATHVYATPGRYTASLVVKDDRGASGRAERWIEVHRTIWRFDVDKPVYYSAPAVASDGTIYFATGILVHTSTGSLYAVRPDGTLKWKFDLENSSDDGSIWTADNNGASPAIGPDGTVYLVDHRNVIYALRPDGTLRWKNKAYESDSAWHVGQKTPAIGVDGTLYVGVGLGLYALHPSDGHEIWRLEGLRGGNLCAVSAAVGGDGTIYIAMNDCFYAVNPDGTLKWPQPFYMFYTHEKSFSAPAIGGDGTIYFGAEGTTGAESQTGRLYALRPNGTLKWCYATPGKRAIRASPAIGADGTVYVTTKAYWDSGPQPALCVALDPRNGSVIWTYEIEPREGTPVAQDSYSSPAVGADGTIYFGAETCFVYALNPDGTLRWKEDFGNGINWSSPAILPDGTLYIGGMRSSEQSIWLGRLSAIRTESLGLANSPWPKFRRDLRNTARAGS